MHIRDLFDILARVAIAPGSGSGQGAVRMATSAARRPILDA